MDLFTAISLVLATFIFAITPGPCSMAVLAVSSTRGVGAAIYFICGGVLGDLLYLSVAIFSLGLLFSYMEPLMPYVKTIGGVYLIYLGYKCFVARAEDLRVDKTAGGFRQFCAGLLVCISNPKVVIFYLSFLPLFIDLSSLDLLSGIELMLIIGVTVSVALLLITLMGSQLRKFIDKPNSVRWLNRFSGSLLAGVGVVIMQS